MSKFKFCNRCDEVKPLEDFTKRRVASGKTVPIAYCKPCRNAISREWQKRNWETYARLSSDRYYKKKYGMASKSKEELLSIQGGGCAICKVTEPRGKGFHVDHCHTSGKVRGILCSECNLMIGKSKDNPEILRVAADYVERNQ